MKTIVRRLRWLEEAIGPPVETEFSRCLREKIEAGRRRVAEAQERGLLPPTPNDDPQREFWRKRLVQATMEAEKRRRLGRRNSYRY